MIKGTTSSGFEFEIEEKNLDDMEFLDALTEAESNGTALSKVCDIMLGKEQKKRLYDHVRDENGKATIEATGKEIIEIMEVSGEDAKNS